VFALVFLGLGVLEGDPVHILHSCTDQYLKIDHANLAFDICKQVRIVDLHEALVGKRQNWYRRSAKKQKNEELTRLPNTRDHIGRLWSLTFTSNCLLIYSSAPVHLAQALNRLGCLESPRRDALQSGSLPVFV